MSIKNHFEIPCTQNHFFLLIFANKISLILKFMTIKQQASDGPFKSPNSIFQVLNCWVN